MITDAILGFFLTIVETVLGWLPDWTYDWSEQIPGTFGHVGPANATLDLIMDLRRWDEALIPMTELGRCVYIFFLLLSALLIYKFVKWVIERIYTGGVV